jgi:hypothetical protein
MFRHTMARSALVLAASLAAVSATGLADVASAATRPPTPAVTVTQVKPLPVPGVTAVPMKKGRPTIRDAFSAGVAGYSDDACGAYLNAYNEWNDQANRDAAAGDAAGAAYYGGLADTALGLLTGNCAVIF